MRGEGEEEGEARASASPASSFFFFAPPSFPLQYEVAFVGQPKDKNQWLMRDWLEAQGWGKAADALDAKEAAMAGLLLKPLTAARIVEHMEKVGLESEFVLHHRMAGLSGGQKIKVVLGAALWQNPHILVMDGEREGGREGGAERSKYYRGRLFRSRASLPTAAHPAAPPSPSQSRPTTSTATRWARWRRPSRSLAAACCS